MESKIEFPIRFSMDQIIDFCRRWKIDEIALFGSVLKPDFNSESDVDVLVTFNEQAPWSLFDFVNMELELEAIFEREVDLVELKGIKNPYRRQHILHHHEVIYASEG